MSIRDLQRKYPHLNLIWTMEQMDRLQRRAAQSSSADVLAFEFDTTIVEINRLAKRNGFFVRPARMVLREEQAS